MAVGERESARDQMMPSEENKHERQKQTKGGGDRRRSEAKTETTRLQKSRMHTSLSI